MADETDRRTRGPGWCPYRGLRPYDAEDERYFFGRERDERALVANVLTAAITLFIGPSGVGKSSLLRAGLPRALRALRDARRFERNIHIVQFQNWPLPDPARRLASLIAEQRGVDTESSRFDEVLAAAFEQSGEQHVVVLDQFEEYFLYHFGEDARDFERQLAAIVNVGAAGTHFLISMREDSFFHLDRLQRRIPAVFQNVVRLRHLTVDDASRAIRRPLDVYNEEFRPEPPIEVEDALVDSLLSEVNTAEVTRQRGASGRLEAAERSARESIETPYLQLALERIWDAEIRADPPSHVLRASTFDEKLGGAAGIARDHMNSVMRSLADEDRVLCTRMFDRLVTPALSKIALGAADLAEPLEADIDDVDRVLRHLASEAGGFLLRAVPSPEGSEYRRYEIFHDVLADPILEWCAEYQSQRRHEEDVRLRRQRGIRIFGLVSACLATFAILAAIVAYMERERAVQKQREAQTYLSGFLTERATGITNAGDGATGALLAIEALRDREILEPALVRSAESALALAYSRLHETSRIELKDRLHPGQEIVASALSDRGDRYAIAYSGRLKVFDSADGRELQSYSIPEEAGIQLRFSPESSLLLAILSSSSRFPPDRVRLYEVDAVGEAGRTIPTRTQDSVVDAGFFRESKRFYLLLARKDDDGQIRRRLDIRDIPSAASRSSAGNLSFDNFRSFDVDRTGRFIVLGGESGLRVLRAGDGVVAASSTARIVRVKNEEISLANPAVVRFGQDANTLYSGHGKGIVAEWRVAGSTLTPRGFYSVNSGDLSDTYEVLDEKESEESSRDQAAQEPRQDKLGARAAVGPDHDAVREILVAKRRPYLVALTHDGIAGWRSGGPPVRLEMKQENPVSARFLSDDDRLATLSRDGKVQLWDFAPLSPDYLGDLKDETRKITPFAIFRPEDSRVVSFSEKPNDGRIVSLLADGTIVNWRQEAANVIRSWASDPYGALLGISVSDDASRMLLPRNGNSIAMIDLASDRILWEKPVGGIAFGSAFAPGGNLVAVSAAGNQDIVVTVLSADDGSVHKGNSFRETANGQLAVVDFDASGRFVVIRTDKGGYSVWDTTSGQKMVLPDFAEEEGIRVPVTSRPAEMVGWDDENVFLYSLLSREKLSVNGLDRPLKGLRVLSVAKNPFTLLLGWSDGTIVEASPMPRSDSSSALDSPRAPPISRWDFSQIKCDARNPNDIRRSNTGSVVAVLLEDRKVCGRRGITPFNFVFSHETRLIDVDAGGSRVVGAFVESGKAEVRDFRNGTTITPFSWETKYAAAKFVGDGRHVLYSTVHGRTRLIEIPPQGSLLIERVQRAIGRTLDPDALKRLLGVSANLGG